MKRKFIGITVVAALAFLTGTILLAPRSAQAHAVQIGSTPASNQQLDASPSQISVTFSEPIEESVTSIQLWDQHAAEVPLGAVSFPSETEMAAQVQDELPTGIYTVIWRNLSTVDGHTWAGSYVFIVLGPNGEVPSGSAPTELQGLANVPSNTPKTLDTAARWLVLLGSAVLVGGVAYTAGAAYPAARVLSSESGDRLRRLSTTVLLVTGTIAALLVLQGSILQLGVQADRLGGFSKVDDILRDTRLGNYLIARQILLLVALGALAMIWRLRNTAASIGAYAVLAAAAIGVLFTQSMVSHAQGGGEGSFWKTSADFLHLLAASLWIGALVHIGLAMPRWLDDLKGAPRTLFAAESFRRFSLLAVVSVSVLIASGIFSALAQFTAWEQLWDTTYGWALIAKLALMVPLLAVGALNALYLGRRVEVAGMRMAGGAVDSNEDLGAIERLQRLLAQTVRIEAVLAIAVLVTVGVLIQLEPARAEAEAEAARAQAGNIISGELPQDEKGYFLKANQAGGLVVALTINPAQVGVNNFEIGLGSEFGSVGEVQLARLEFANAAANISESELDLPLAGSAKWVADGANISQAGEWEITATIRRRGEDDVTTTFTVPVRSGDATAAASGSEGGRFSWPFEGAQSAAAIAALLLGVVVTAGAATWQLREFRRT